MLWRHRVAVFVAVLATSCSSALTQGAVTDPVPGSSTITIENASARLILSPDGEIQSLALHDGRELLAQGEVLNVQLQVSLQSYLHFYLPIDFTGWKYCELGEPEGDRVMDYFHYEKFALHALPLDRFNAVTLMLLNPPAGKQVDLRLGRIEALQELGGELVKPEIQVGNQSLDLPINLLPEQYLETGDPWVSRDPGLCRVFDADGNELKRVELGPSLSLESGPVSLRLDAEGSPTARAKVTLLLEGTADGQKAPPKRSESDQ